MDASALPDRRPKTAVLHQFTGIGDLVWHLRYFRAVAAQSLAGRVTVIAQPSTLARQLLAHEPWVEAIIDHDHRPRRGEKRHAVHGGMRGTWRMARQLREHGFGRLVLFSGRPSRGLLAWFSGIPTRMGYGYNPLQRIFLNAPPYISRHKGSSVAVYHEATAFAIAHGFTDTPLVPRLDVPPEHFEQAHARLAGLPRPLYALAVGTSETHKQWGASRFAALASSLVAKGAGVVLLGGPSERQLTEEILALVPPARRACVVAVTDLKLLGSAAVLQAADACVGNDTGMVNISAAVGRPTWVLLGSRPALDHDPQLVSISAPTLTSISPDMVLERLLAHPSAGTLRAASVPDPTQGANP